MVSEGSIGAEFVVMEGDSYGDKAKNSTSCRFYTECTRSACSDSGPSSRSAFISLWSDAWDLLLCWTCGVCTASIRNMKEMKGFIAAHPAVLEHVDSPTLQGHSCLR